MKKKLIIASGFVMGLTPVLALAQLNTGGNPTRCSASSNNISDLQGLMCKFGELLGAILPILIGLGVVYFVWGVISYVISADEEAKKAGRDRIIFGIIGLAVIVGLWGLVGLVTETFDLENTSTINVPTVPR
jgi:hypothetical protein